MVGLVRKTIFLLIFLILLVGCELSMNKTTQTQKTTITTTEIVENKEHYFNDIVLVTETPKAYELVEFALIQEVDIKSIHNPYDYQEIKIIGEFTSPSAKVYKIPAFWTKDYDITLDPTWTQPPGDIQGMASRNPEEIQGLEMVVFKGEEHYRLRFLPEESGSFELIVKVYVRDELVQVLKTDIEVHSNSTSYHGIIKVEPTHKRNLIFTDGKTFIPIGQNTGWYTSSTRKTYDYQIWFENMAANGMNATRIWMATWGFALHWDDYRDFTKRLNQAARLDRVVKLAHEHDIYFILSLLNHGQFSAITNPEWSLNPWNVRNGGILKTPNEFFYKREAKEIYKSQLLYIIARWGYSDHIMAWELWNEVDWTDNYNELDVTMWHKEMAEFIKANDPYNHLVTTSSVYETLGAYKLDSIDFVNPHNYGYANLNILHTLPPRLELIWQQYKKPVFHSEIGINWQSGPETANMDPEGITLHQQSWAGMMGGSLGGAMNWWFDSWVHHLNLYHRFKGAATYAKELNMVGSTYEQLRLEDKISISHDDVGILGYRIDNRIYGYLYDIKWKYNYPEIYTKYQVVVKIPFANGTYTLRVFDTMTGEVLSTSTLDVSNEMVELRISFKEDIAFIIE